MARSKKTTKEPSKAQLEELIEEAIVDASDESEQSTGFFTMFEEYLEIPFTCQVQSLSILDLPLPNSRPKG